MRMGGREEEKKQAAPWSQNNSVWKWYHVGTSLKPSWSVKSSEMRLCLRLPLWFGVYLSFGRKSVQTNSPALRLPVWQCTHSELHKELNIAKGYLFIRASWVEDGHRSSHQNCLFKMTATEWLAQRPEKTMTLGIPLSKTTSWDRRVGKKEDKELSFSQLFIHSSRQNTPENNIALW